MDLEKVLDFCKIGLDSGAVLRTLLDMPCAGSGPQDAARRIGRIVRTLRDTAADIDSLLSLDAAQRRYGRATLDCVQLSASRCGLDAAVHFPLHQEAGIQGKPLAQLMDLLSGLRQRHFSQIRPALKGVHGRLVLRRGTAPGKG